MNINEKSLNKTNELPIFSLENQVESGLPTISRRSGLPRLTSNFPSVLHSRSPVSESNHSGSFISHNSPLSRFQPLALKRVFSGQINKERNQQSERNIGCSPRSSKPSCSSWIPSFHSKGSNNSTEWDISLQEERDYKESWRDDSSTFSKQLAKITRGSNEDLWTSCRPCLSVPRPAWPADGSHSFSERRGVTKECIGSKVVVGGKEKGILRYFGRTAFASGLWCGVELDAPVGKNDGSVDGVIYFSCKPGYGIFAPDIKVSVLEYSEIQLSMKNSKYGGGSSNNSNPLYRLSGTSSSSSSSGLSGHSIDSLRSSGASSATYTIVGRANDSIPSSPNDSKSLYKDYTIREGDVLSDPISPETGTCDDSSLGILTPDQMADLTMTASASFERSPSDENVSALEDEVCEDYGAVGGTVERWDSQGSISGVEEEIIQRDISAIIRELRIKDCDNSSSSGSSHTNYTEEVDSDKSQNPVEIKAISLKSSKPLEEEANILLEKVQRENFSAPEKTPSPLNASQSRSISERSPAYKSKSENDTEMSEWQAGVSNMTTSAASLDQGYQGDGEFDVPSEAGSATASSPTEDPHIFEGVIDMERISLDPNSSAATEADISLADDETESENGVIPRDRTARIIDGKLYHSHRELVALRHGDGRHEAHTSEMDSSGFYSDLDPREEESTRMEAPSLQPLKESKLDVDLHDSVLDDTTQEDEMEEYAAVTNPQEITEQDSKDKATSNEDSSLIDEDDKSSTCTIRSEQKDVSSSDNVPCVPSDSSISCNDKVSHSFSETSKDIATSSNLSRKNKPSETDQSTEVSQITPTDSESFPIKPLLEEDSQSKCENEASVTIKPRNYEKPWLSKPPPPRRIEKPKIILPPPPPMPKKNVQSKLKALLEASEPPPEDRRPRQQKKGRWDEVMSRIEEGKKEEKVRPKVKEVKSRLLEALKAPQPVSPQVERIRQERRERRERRERQAAANAAARRMSERKRSSVASSKPSRAPSLDSIGGIPPLSVDSRASTPEVSQHSTTSSSAASGVPNTPGVRAAAKDRGPRPLPNRAVSRLSGTSDAPDEKKCQEMLTAASRRSKIDNSKAALTKTFRGTATVRGKQTDPVKILRPTAPNGQTPSPLPSQISEQLKKLEAEISARTQEAQKSREEVAKANGGIEALTVLVHYLTNEYDAFSTPKLRAEIESLTSQLTDVRLCLDESSAAARRLEIEAAEQCQKHEEVVNNLEEAHRQEVSSITLEHQRKLDEVVEKHKKDLNDAKNVEEEKRELLITAHKEQLERIEAQWKEELDKQHQRHLQALEQLNACHNEQLRSSEEAWKLREQELQESNAKLLKEQNNLKQQAKKLEETLLSDKDHRLQAAKRVCGALQNEVDSLKTVVDMRNSEVHKLRDQLADKERICEELDSARDRVRALQAKAEDLHAQMETKLQLERQLLTDRHSLTESLQREASVNKRLSLENEELQWKLRQRDSTPNSSHTSSSLDLVSRCSPGNARQQEGCNNGVLSPQFTPRSQRIGTKPHDKKWSQSFSNIPEDAGKLLRRTELHHGNVMIESPPPSPRVKAVIEKSNSVSFILDLNDTYPNEHLIGAQSYHQLRKSSTSNLQRKPFTKSYSSNLEKSKSTSLVQGSSKTFDVNKSSREKLNKKENVNGECDSDVYKTENGKHSKYDRTCSTSESSDSGEIERISPTGLSWTVPVHSKRYSKHIPSNRFQLVPETPRLLQQPDEDEYEEAENENEFVEVLALGEDISSAPLTMLFAQTPSTSVSLSDSDVSQCGSRADITSDDDDDDDDDDDGTLLQKESQSRPQEGAGEAMIYSDVFDLKRNNGSCKSISKSQISSGPSSDSEDANQATNVEEPLNLSWSEDIECDLTSSSEMQELL